MKKSASKRQAPGEDSNAGVPPAQDGVAAYNKLMAHAELLSVNLVKTSAAINLERFVDDELIVQVAPPLIRGGFVEETRTLSSGVRLSIKLAPRPSETTTPHDESTGIVEVEAEYAVEYRVAVGVDVDEATTKLFVSRNAVFGAWPFFRELVHSLVSRMNISPLILPLYRMPPLPKAGSH